MFLEIIRSCNDLSKEDIILVNNNNNLSIHIKNYFQFETQDKRIRLDIAYRMNRRRPTNGLTRIYSRVA